MAKATPRIPKTVATLGEVIRHLREKQGLTLRGLALKAGISAPFLSDIEHNRRGTEKIPALAKALGVGPEVLHAYDGRIPQDLEDWIRKNPEIVGLLTDLRASGREPSDARAILSRRRR